MAIALCRGWGGEGEVRNEFEETEKIDRHENFSGRRTGHIFLRHFKHKSEVCLYEHSLRFHLEGLSNVLLSRIGWFVVSDANVTVLL